MRRLGGRVGSRTLFIVAIVTALFAVACSTLLDFDQFDVGALDAYGGPNNNAETSAPGDANGSNYGNTPITEDGPIWATDPTAASVSLRARSLGDRLRSARLLSRRRSLRSTR